MLAPAAYASPLARARVVQVHHRQGAGGLEAVAVGVDGRLCALDHRAGQVRVALHIDVEALIPRPDPRLRGRG